MGPDEQHDHLKYSQIIIGFLASISRYLKSIIGVLLRLATPSGSKTYVVCGVWYTWTKPTTINLFLIADIYYETITTIDQG